ncbi:MAG TPA: glycosyltransferase family 4 protein [Pyrinomonadaceae bacterium]|jgi:glycosyltransferase involved in cell wall biosynthesis|nr:glycosyltransferase family 4 protein [Pyrinomonadaceae bacterium]
MRVFVLTDSPSPYQVELFNEIEAGGNCELKVGYLRSRDPQRQWARPDIRHDSIEIDRRLQDARAAVHESDLVVFNYYFHSQATELIEERASRGGPWCFWGERPGFRQAAWAAFGGRLLRRWKLARLHGSSMPIWGIGKFAVDEYRREFGLRRSYFNLPYFSNLERFGNARSQARSERVFLFSGSLIERKGVDLVARAFVRLVADVPDVRLRIAGDGELRESLVQVLRSVSERVEFLGFKDWSELPELYASADVLCVPSRYDGWGLVVPEGLASGLPVIATERMGAALEFVQTGVNGWLIPAGDEMAILSAMRAAASLTNAEFAERSQRARESVKEHTLRNGSQRFVRFARETIGV